MLDNYIINVQYVLYNVQDVLVHCTGGVNIMVIMKFT